MRYYFSKILELPYNETRKYVEEKLAKNGFGVVSEIHLHDKFKAKLDVDFHKYTILGACSPKHAYKAINVESKIGVFLPCNVIIQEISAGKTEVTAVDPIASMQAVQNNNLADVANEIKDKLKLTIESL